MRSITDILLDSFHRNEGAGQRKYILNPKSLISLGKTGVRLLVAKQIPKNSFKATWVGTFFLKAISISFLQVCLKNCEKLVDMNGYKSSTYVPLF